MSTYFLHGGPAGEPRTLRDQPDEPVHLLTIERVTEPGTVDGYVLETYSDTFNTASYQWFTGGTPEHVMTEAVALAGRIKKEQQP